MKHQDPLKEWLQSLSEIEPPFGFKTRIMAAIQEKPALGLWEYLRLAIPVAAVSAVIIIGIWSSLKLLSSATAKNHSSALAEWTQSSSSSDKIIRSL